VEFLIASQSTEGGDCANAELANTKSDIERMRIGRPRSAIVRQRLSLIEA
jgi:hypothetical protein